MRCCEGGPGIPVSDRLEEGGKGSQEARAGGVCLGEIGYKYIAYSSVSPRGLQDRGAHARAREGENVQRERRSRLFQWPA